MNKFALAIILTIALSMSFYNATPVDGNPQGNCQDAASCPFNPNYAPNGNQCQALQVPKAYDNNKGAENCNVGNCCRNLRCDLDFVCPTGWVYKDTNAASNELNACCQKTCAVFECPPFWTINPDNVFSTDYNTPTCCLKTCQAQGCSQDWNPRPEQASHTAKDHPIDDAHCCKPTCNLFDCGDSTNTLVHKKNPHDDSDFTHGNCCANTCLSHQCSNGWARDNSKNNDDETQHIVDDGNCCKQSCSLYQCNANYHAHKLTDTSDFSHGNCCAPTCLTHQCSPKWNRDNNKNNDDSDSHPIDDQNCCLQTCELFSCDPNFQNHHLTDSTEFSKGHCCVETCLNHQCSIKWVRDQSKNNDNKDQHDINDFGCCKPTCELFACNPTYNHHNNGTSDNWDHDHCCVKSCRAHVCSADWVVDDSKSNNDEDTSPTNDQNCCKQTCTLFQCPEGYNHKNHEDSNNFSQDHCCEQSCAAFTCDFNTAGLLPKVGVSTLSPATNDLCCAPSCSFFTCPQGYNWLSTVASNVYDQNHCCQLIPTCGNSFTCPSFYTAINLASTTVSLSNCCQPYCDLFGVANSGYNCPNGLYYDGSASGMAFTSANASSCCVPIIQVSLTCASSVTCINGDVPIAANADSTDTTYSNCCQAVSCPTDTFLNAAGVCQPCQWDIIDPPNDATYNWCKCNCYTPGTTDLNEGVCWLKEHGNQIFPKECKWVCNGNERTSSNGTLSLDKWVDQCILTPQCNSNCYSCAKTNSSQCTSCFYGQTLINGQCICPNGKLSIYATCPK